MSSFNLPRYYKRQERNGFWSLMPLRGRYATDAVMVNGYTYHVLELLESGKTPREVLEQLFSEFPDQEERKVRIDLFHTLARLGKYDLIDISGFSEGLAVLDERKDFLRNCVQPCPINNISVLADYLKQFENGGSGSILYNALARVPRPGHLETTGIEVLSDPERMLESQTTGGEIYWASVDHDGEIVGAAVTANYMLLQPVVVLNIVAVSGMSESQKLQQAVNMVSSIAETLGIFGLNEKLRVTSCPFSANESANLTILDKSFYTVLGQCQFKKAALMKGEINAKYDVEYYDRTF